MPQVLHQNVRFRGSLGDETVGHAGFGAYVERVHRGLASYQCIIEDMVAEGHQVFTKMRFTGVHQGDFMGYPPTGQTVSWSGAALFTFDGERVSDVWVLGDLVSLNAQLKRAAEA